MKKIGALLFKTINALLAAITLLGFGVLLFKQLPTDDIHHGYGVIFFSLFLAPCIIFPLAITSLIGASNYYEDNKKKSPFYLTCLAIAVIGLLFAIALLVFKDMYSFINLNPQTHAQGLP